MKTKSKELNRHQIKSVDGKFLYELQNSFELSPRLSEQILLTAKNYLQRDELLCEGQIEVTLIGIEERSGKLIENMEKRRVRLTIDAGYEDICSLKEYGRRGLRQIKIQRISEEAIEQLGVMSQEDLGRHLGCSVRTIKRDIREIKSRGIEVITRGVLHNIGRGQTHKSRIIGMYLDGLTYSEIKRKTRHSVGALKRYIESFVKVLLAQRRGIIKYRDISAVTGLSDNLVKQYQELIRESKKDKTRKEAIDDLIGRYVYKPAVKKTRTNFGMRAEVTTGGCK
jgi:DNA-binding Lrp family transcriptional regulator